MIHPFSSSFFANPANNSALTTLGTKPRVSRVVFSVGVQAPLYDSYITKDAEGANPSVTITNGILEFSCQQSHPYIGIGDKVQIIGDESIYVYLNEKISLYKWKVTDRYGNVPENITGLNVYKIDKTFSSLREAIAGDTPGAYNNIETYDLVTKRMQLYITCYKMTEDLVDASITFSDNWIIDEECNIKISAPVDIGTECNSIQRSQIRGSSTDGFVIYTEGSTLPVIHIVPHISVSGLIIGDDDGPGPGTRPGYGFFYDAVYMGEDLSIEIFDNVIVNVDYAINLAQRPRESMIYNNIIKRCNSGILVSGIILS